MSGPMVVGAVLFFAGMITFMAVIFGSGGARKSRQFRVIGEVLHGKHGPGRKRAAISGMVAIGVGAVLLFAGIAMKDRARAERCRAYCKAAGYDRGTIGPSTATMPDNEKAAAFVACTCTAAGKAPLELRADALTDP